MKSILVLIIFMGGIYNMGKSQEVIELPIVVSDASVQWETAERQFHSNTWDTEVVTNVSKPILTVFPADPTKNTGTSVVICPGGALYAHSIESEGSQVAEWLAAKGVTAFVLKYRLVPTGLDGTSDAMQEGAQVEVRARQVLPMATSDGLQAILHVRANAEKYKINRNRIGIMGFSAGGAVTMSVCYNYDEASRPDFIAPVYWWKNVVGDHPIPEDAPPMFVACASDDPLQLAPASIDIYNQWLAKGKSAELHVYAKGGHGFGMRVQNLPSDKWIEAFGAWLDGQGLMTP